MASLIDAVASLEPANSKRRTRDVVELCLGVGLILAVIWAPRRRTRFALVAAAVWLPVVIWNSFESWKKMGLDAKNFPRSLWIVAVALFFSGSAIAVARNYKTLNLPANPEQFLERYGGYTLWTFGQQFLLVNFILRRLLCLIPGSEWIAASIAALLFALAHLPNLFLAPVTFFWGLAACLLFLRYGNLYSLSIAHAIMGIGLAVTVPAALSHRMLIGASYYEDDPALPPASIPDSILSPQLPMPADKANTATGPTPDFV
jgi:membrane protease YdiL (CAAX protease family)